MRARCTQSFKSLITDRSQQVVAHLPRGTYYKVFHSFRSAQL
jgi:hypothetical protein